MEKFTEENHQDILKLRYPAEERLFFGKSDFQTVEVVQTKGHGKMLFNDGIAMVSERDEFVYHEMIAHVPLFVHPRAKEVLVIGGGDGGTAREVIRHPEVDTCTMVEIDKMVVDACREHLPVCSGQLSHPKVDLHIQDGVDFLKNTEKKFDLILVDSTDPIGPATPLFGPQFYRDVERVLSDDGIVVSQGESPWYESKMQNKLLEMKSELFPIVTCYNYSNLTYPGGIWTFTWGSKRYHPLRDFDQKRFCSSQMSCKYYNENVHRAAFSHPQFQAEQIRAFIKGF